MTVAAVVVKVIGVAAGVVHEVAVVEGMRTRTRTRTRTLDKSLSRLQGASASCMQSQ